ncbi:hypothetical protein AB0L13_30920 [Saccharopolyspora shandongensis]|uniref:hypothetical protein n=1 Tax=Saccharopolyspora shandongensis TaxID=418495 RepID=UPI0034314300
MVDTRWDTPETARNRLAAHHSYVAAVDAARRAIDAWQAAAAVLDTVAAFRPGAVSDYLIGVYERSILAAGYRPVDKPDIDVATASPLPARRCGNRHIAGSAWWLIEG